jgi:hypothetical protein
VGICYNYKSSLSLLDYIVESLDLKLGESSGIEHEILFVLRVLNVAPKDIHRVSSGSKIVTAVNQKLGRVVFPLAEMEA